METKNNPASSLLPLSVTLTQKEAMQRLKAMQVKMRLGMPLSPAEENLAADLAADREMERSERVVSDADGVHVTRTVRVDGMFDAIKARMESEAHGDGGRQFRAVQGGETNSGNSSHGPSVTGTSLNRYCASLTRREPRTRPDT